jgi:hypothetical protein
MSMTMQAFTIEELEKLSEHQVTLLQFAVEREIRNSSEIKGIIRDKFEPMLNRMTAESNPVKFRKTA